MVCRAARLRVVIGVGCDRGAQCETLAKAVDAALRDAGLEAKAVAALATIDIKSDEAALLSLAELRGWPVACFSAAELAEIEVPHPSLTVERYTGTPSVSAAAALRYANADCRALLIEKRRRRDSDGKNVTVSLAMLGESEQGAPKQAPTGAGSGKIVLVGIGPGDSSLMCKRAQQAIAAADVIIGYKTYLDLVTDLIDDKTVISKGMTEELERAEQAYAHAVQGKSVALVSSGDAGVYGMAAPTFELLLERGQRADLQDDIAVSVEVIPGITALSASASLVGAPLSHDFCTISLSDLLTPWPVIARRIEAAARGDFVVALYNPASKKRIRHIQMAQQIMLRYRSAQTPVAIIRSAYREGQSTEQTCLGELHNSGIDMLSTVLIGNSSTYQYGGQMITPRGYSAKYSGSQAHSGAVKRGHSLPMGLDGWHGQVRDWLRGDNELGIEAAMQHFDAPWAEVLVAVDEQLTGPEDPYRSSRIAPQKLCAAVNELCRLPALTVVPATPQGVSTRLDIAPDAVSLSEDRLDIATGHSSTSTAICAGRSWGKSDGISSEVSGEMSVMISIVTRNVAELFWLHSKDTSDGSSSISRTSLEMCDKHGNLLLRLSATTHTRERGER